VKGTTYLALLRGINVGGANIIRMTDLKKCFETLGCREVRTFIQSGNVVFESSAKDERALVKTIEQGLADEFKPYAGRVVLRSEKEMTKIVATAPPGFGGRPAAYRYDVIFLRPPLTASKAIAEVPAKEGVDEVFTGPGVLYFTRLIAKATQSRLSRLTALPIYKEMTVRNWNTTTKLLGMMEQQA
jgi:uncharacterized protein (DUF1697 family)